MAAESSGINGANIILVTKLYPSGGGLETHVHLYLLWPPANLQTFCKLILSPKFRENRCLW